MGSFEIDSAGTSGFHAGERADTRMLKHANKRGIDLPSRSRQLTSQDFSYYDYIVVMDDSNYQNCLSLLQDSSQEEKIYKMAEFATSFEQSEVPDPYYGGAQGFETVLDMVTEGAENLLTKIMSDHERDF